MIDPGNKRPSLDLSSAQKLPKKTKLLTINGGPSVDEPLEELIPLRTYSSETESSQGEYVTAEEPQVPTHPKDTSSDPFEKALEPIYACIEASEAAENALFEHVQLLNEWKDSLDMQGLVESMKEDVSFQLHTSMQLFQDMSCHNLQQWKSEISEHLLNLMSNDRSGAADVAQDLKNVWTMLSQKVETL